MKVVRIKINDLIDQHGATFGDCPGCSICQEIAVLKDKLSRDPLRRVRHILDKGADMKLSEIKILLDDGVKKKVIQKHLNMSENVFNTMMHGLGYSRSNKKKQNLEGEHKMAKTVKITKEEYQDLKAQGITDKAIAERKGMTPSYLSALKKEWNINSGRGRKEKAKPVENKEVGEVKVITQAPDASKRKDKEKEYESLLADLRAQLNAKDDQIMELEGLFVEAQEQKDQLHDCCDDLEKEIETMKKDVAEAYERWASLMEESSAEIEMLKQNLEELKAERKPLMEFALYNLQKALSV